MKKVDLKSNLSQRIIRMIALSISLSLAIILILQAQRNGSHVAAQDRTQTQKNKALTQQIQSKKSSQSPSKPNVLNTALFDPASELLDSDYAIELIPESRGSTQHQTDEISKKFKVHQPNPKSIRYLKYQVVQLLKSLENQEAVTGLTEHELSGLKKLYSEIKRNTRMIHNPFAHTSKSMAPSPVTQTQPIPVDPQTLAALNKLVKLKR